VAAVRFLETPLAGAFVLEPERSEDERGYFQRIWSAEELAGHGLTATLAYTAISFNARAGTLRGLHYQRAPHEEAKLVRCLTGSLLDVIVDLRPGSPTHRQWFAVELDAESGRSLFVPEGLAHGFQTLADGTRTLYHISTRWAPEAAAGVRWDDPAFGVAWPDAPERTISERDRTWPDFTC
jgi:dTDP-4-dehydrorhamnose 3,5-epimerase